MPKPRFLADHNLNELIVDGTLRREPTIEFVRARSAGLAEATDPRVLEFAAANGLIVVSHDVNTMPAHACARVARGQLMAGLLMTAQYEAVGAVIESLVLIATCSDADEWRGQVCYLPL